MGYRTGAGFSLCEPAGRMCGFCYGQVILSGSQLGSNCMLQFSKVNPLSFLETIFSNLYKLKNGCLIQQNLILIKSKIA